MFGQWNSLFPSHDRTTGAFGPLGCMGRVWAMEWAMALASKDYWSFWATWLQVVFGQWNTMELVGRPIGR